MSDFTRLPQILLWHKTLKFGEFTTSRQSPIFNAGLFNDGIDFAAGGSFTPKPLLPAAEVRYATGPAYSALFWRRQHDDVGEKANLPSAYTAKKPKTTACVVPAGALKAPRADYR